jgi:diguanylate cyclase (GGDEF)-like protein/putative nucleotidyltransferase with HDIG domain
MRTLRGKGDLEAELAAARRRNAALQAELTERNARDSLTASLLTLRAFRAQLDLDVRRAQRYRRPLSIALLDVDGFRAVNSSAGYSAGDELLAAVGEAITRTTRAHDLACRTGGDEYAILLAETESGDARLAVERLLLDLEDVEVAGLHGVSASAGVADLTVAVTPEGLLAAARDALEEARESGGGRVAECPPVASANGAKESTPEQADTVAALVSALAERDRYTGDHSESVVDVAARVAESLAVPQAEVELISKAALLHDIGKVGVPDQVLHKPGPLDDGEWELMREHPAIGERILRSTPGMGQVAKIVRHEHERWDGNGYPDGLSGHEIPLGSRIILACDAYHAMTSDRPYRQAMPHADAVAELSAGAGTQFDPHVVEALVGYLYGRRQAGLAAI